MGSSTGNMLVDQETVLEGIFRNSPTIIATHCEDTPTILANEEMHEKSSGIWFHFPSMELFAPGSMSQIFIHGCGTC